MQIRRAAHRGDLAAAEESADRYVSEMFDEPTTVVPGGPEEALTAPRTGEQQGAGGIDAVAGSASVSAIPEPRHR